MKKVIIFSIFILSLVPCYSARKYNGQTGKWEEAKEDSRVRYNYMEDKYQFKGKNDHLKYNGLSNKWEFADDKDKIRYNYMEDKFQYSKPGSRLKYNSMEDKWEYEKK